MTPQDQISDRIPPPCPRRILIIEDNLDAAGSLRDVLELGHHEVVVAHDGREGLVRACEHPPEFVLCDIGLPDIDGYAAARAFHAEKKLRGAILVALSGHVQPDDIARAAEAGFQYHMPKPPSLERLTELLAQADPASALKPACTTSGVRVLLVEDNPGDADLVREVLDADASRWVMEHVLRLSECLSRLGATGVDVVVLDLSLPDASGLTGVAELVRLHPEVPIVVLTGMGDADVGARAVQQGAQEYLIKGELDGRTLGRVLRYAIERHTLARRAQALAGENATKAASDEERRRVVLVADASIAISSTLDEDEALARLDRVLVPRLATFVAREWLDPNARVCCRVTAVGSDGLHREYDLSAREPEASVRLRARCAQPGRIQPSLPEPWVPWREIWQQASGGLLLKSAMVLPLEIRGEALGVLTLARGDRYVVEDLAVAQEIARRASAGVESARLYQQALDAVQVRDDFISIAGHELRTPLMSLLLDVQRLAALDAPTPDKLKSTSQRVARCGERLRSLIDDLLDVSRIRTGRLVLECVEVDLVAVVKEVTDRYLPEMTRVGSPLSLTPSAPIVGRWDRSRIQQVVANLLQNAARYGAGKPIEIALEHGDGRARLCIRDHGCGIDPRDQDRIFERFARASSMVKKEGMGLGLWITREIVHAHGGTITVDSRLGEGAEFRVELPCAGPPASTTGGK